MPFADREPSASLLFYVFADRIAPRSFWGAPAPRTGTRVDRLRLATVLFAVAFWELRQKRSVSLELDRDDGGPAVRIRLAVDPGPVRIEESPGGLEAGIISLLTPNSLGQLTPAWDALPGFLRSLMQRALASGEQIAAIRGVAEEQKFPPPPDTVVETVTRWYGTYQPYPSQLPIEWTRREGVAKNVLVEQSANRNPLASLFFGRATFTPRPEDVPELESSFNRILEGWQSFQVGEPELSRQLEADVREGIRARGDTSD